MKLLPLPGAAVHVDRAVVARDNPARKSETESARPPSDATGRIDAKERLEEVRDGGGEECQRRYRAPRPARAAPSGEMCTVMRPPSGVNLIALSSRFSSSRSSQPASPIDSHRVGASHDSAMPLGFGDRLELLDHRGGEHVEIDGCAREPISPDSARASVRI